MGRVASFRRERRRFFCVDVRFGSLSPGARTAGAKALWVCLRRWRNALASQPVRWRARAGCAGVGGTAPAERKRGGGESAPQARSLCHALHFPLRAFHPSTKNTPLTMSSLRLQKRLAASVCESPVSPSPFLTPHVEGWVARGRRRERANSVSARRRGGSRHRAAHPRDCRARRRTQRPPRPVHPRARRPILNRSQWRECPEPPGRRRGELPPLTRLPAPLLTPSLLSPSLPSPLTGPELRPAQDLAGPQ